MKINTINIIKVGLLIALVDLLLAFIHAYIFNAVEPIKVLHYVASGLLGREAFDGGLVTAFYGLIFHMIIAVGWTAIFYLLFENISMFSKNRFPFGVTFGLFIWLVMNLVIVPLSDTPPQKAKSMLPLLTMIIIHMFLGYLMALYSRKLDRN